ncbi:leukocyte surface antigen CD53-like isoform X2 [Wyeomyia smithii]|uniref:leukocyte surface antigen CD53-like isoform X2 n=1 Tax=Wyeomyia smithii TaxID=174621 RepID=UPI002467E78F|nr:leukocyte surface antigen CD53-like isoform X2 [Wyeomyia smithii]
MSGYAENPQGAPQQPPLSRIITRKSLSIIKYLILLLMVMCLILEIIAIVLGASTGNVFAEFQLFLDNQFHALATFIVVLGIFMLLVVLCGCIGIMLENMSAVGIFIVVYSMMIVLEIIIVISTYSLIRNTYRLLEVRMKSVFLDFYRDRNSHRSVNHMQQRLQCCGLENYSDWYNWPHHDDSQSTVPMSCFASPQFEVPFEVGCLNRMNELIGAVVFTIQLRNYRKHEAIRVAASANTPPIFRLDPIPEEKTPI